MRPRRAPLGSESGQALLLLVGVAASLVVGSLALAALGKALGAKGRHQRAADLAAISAARTMRALYPRLFEPPFLEPGIPNPHHISTAQYMLRARLTAIGAASRNGARVTVRDVTFPAAGAGPAVARLAAGAAAAFAPTRVRVAVRGTTRVLVGVDGGPRTVHVKARATAEITPSLGGPAQPPQAGGGGYQGPLAYRTGKPMRPDVARAFDRMAAAARREGIELVVTSGYRSDAEQAHLFAAHPDPKWVAPPGRSLHRLGTELDLGPPSAYGWLRANAERFGFIQRYSWEPWHYGFVRNPGTTSVGFGRPGTPDGRRSALPSFVPPRLAPLILDASQRRNVSAALLAAQLYAESGFNPFAVSPAGARGLAQFMPGTARSYGLRDPFDPRQSIDAQARLMRDLLRRFASVPLALAAYNAGPAAVARCGCIPPYAETQAYVSRILGLLGGAGDLALPTFGVHLVE
jgi:transglycosylase-like protein with SLT domain/D-alanyl-D-alanine carboxypeptidase-like protein